MIFLFRRGLSLSGPILVALLVLCSPFQLVHAADSVEVSAWDQFRGMHRNGRITDGRGESGSGTEQLSLVWKQEIGSGFSEVVVAGSKLYTLMAEKTDSLSGTEYLVCLDTATGSEQWRVAIDDIYIDADAWGDGPRSTPAIDGERIYCFSGSGKLVALSLADRRQIWEVDFVATYGSTVPRWGFSASPLLLGDKLFMEVGGDQERAFVAFNKYTGEQLWAGGQAPAAYNSPVYASIEGEEYIFFVNGASLFAYTPNGTHVWTFTMPLRSPMALPLFIEPNKLFVSAANDAGSFVLEITNGQPQQILTSTQIRNDWSSSSYHNGYIYGFNVASLQCMDIHDGTRKWMKRGFGKGSLITVNDLLVILSDTGTLALAQLSPDGYNELDTISAIEGRSWTAPSYADGKIYVRNHTHIACIQIVY